MRKKNYEIKPTCKLHPGPPYGTIESDNHAFDLGGMMSSSQIFPVLKLILMLWWVRWSQAFWNWKNSGNPVSADEVFDWNRGMVVFF